MNQSSQKTLIAVLIAAIIVALVALGITAGIYYGKTHPKQTADNPAALETTAVSQTVTTVSVTTTAESETSVISTTETAAETTVTEALETTISEEEIPEPQEEAPAEEETPAEETPPAEEPAPALPYISSAEIVGVYNDYGAGYMFRLDLQGNYAYWVAEVTETEFAPGNPYVHTVSSRDLTPNYPYITGGSTINTLRATITPYDANGVAGTPFTTVWDQNRTEHQ